MKCYVQKLERKTEFNLVVGINGTGKTTWLNNNAVMLFKKSLVVTAHDGEWQNLPVINTAKEIYDLQGKARIIYEGKQTLDNLLYYHGGSLVLDDARMFMSAKTIDSVRKIYISRRQRGVDVFISAHGLRQVPVEAFTFASWLFLFNTSENFSDRKKELLPEKYEEIINAQTEVRKKVLTGDPYYFKKILLDDQIKANYEATRKTNG